ncbi:MAG: DUF6506 family protein [Desulfuromusa sp.]
MALKAAFIFLAPGAEAQKHRSLIVTPEVELVVVGVPDYSSAEALTLELIAEGITAIELCGGFGHSGTARIVRAAKGEAAVGVVRFDCHPGLGGTSGDTIFSS